MKARRTRLSSLLRQSPTSPAHTYCDDVRIRGVLSLDEWRGVRPTTTRPITRLDTSKAERCLGVHAMPCHPRGRSNTVRSTSRARIPAAADEPLLAEGDVRYKDKPERRSRSDERPSAARPSR